MQRFSSAKTSINSNKLPVIYGKVSPDAPIVLDYGCGKYTDHIREHIEEQGKQYLPFDPYNQSIETNRKSIETAHDAMVNRIPVDVICSNVLNVIDDPDTVRSIAQTVEAIAEASGGTGYITVYEGNRSGIGKQTGSDQFQRNEPVRNYLKYFRCATIKNGVIIVR